MRRPLLGILAALVVFAAAHRLLDTWPTDPLDARLRSVVAGERGRPFAMADVTSFAWDRLYVLGPYAHTSAIRELSSERPSISEGACLFVFLQGDAVVHRLVFERRHGDFTSVARTTPYPRDDARFVVPVDQPGEWPKIRVAAPRDMTASSPKVRAEPAVSVAKDGAE